MHTLDAGFPIDDSANDGGQSGREPTRVKQPSETVLADAINFMAAIARTLGTSIILQGLDFAQGRSRTFLSLFFETDDLVEFLFNSLNLSRRKKFV